MGRLKLDFSGRRGKAAPGDCHQSVAELSRQRIKMGKIVARVLLHASTASILFAPQHLW